MPTKNSVTAPYFGGSRLYRKYIFVITEQTGTRTFSYYTEVDTLSSVALIIHLYRLLLKSQP